MEKIKKTIFIAIFVSLAAQIRFNFLVDGFIVAMSVMVMAIFIYCYDDLSPRYVAFCSGIFSPLLRMVFEILDGGAAADTVPLVLPDMAFFFTYGLLYPVVYRYVVRMPKSIRSFSYVVFSCDFLSNMAEVLTRSFLNGQNLLTGQNLAWLVLIAFCRTFLIQVILIAMEAHSNLLLQEEHDKEYKKLLVQASILEGELYVMEKNAAEIEEIMRQAFRLYNSMSVTQAPREMKNLALDISKNAHEIKGDYLNIIQVLKETFVDDVGENSLLMSKIIAIEKMNLQSVMKARDYRAEIQIRMKTDFAVRNYFEMMSILRNLMLNGAEAIHSRGSGEGRITVTLRQDEDGPNYVLTVRDTGTGISKDNMETVFFDGFSTKFNLETGDVQRGIGLTLVKDYVESVFHGTITIESEVGKYTEFIVTMPKACFKEAEDEVLHR